MLSIRFLSITWLAAIARAFPVCNDNVTLTVTTSILVDDLRPLLNIGNLTSANSTTNALVEALTNQSTLLGNIPTNTYTIAGRYCEPEVFNSSRQNTIELLVHGATYDRNYWSGLGPPGSELQFNGTNYSWVDYASLQGYPTFSIDRICNGKSSHPDGTLCQYALDAATIHEVIKLLRAGAVAGRSFSEVIFIGHSLGSLIANTHAQMFPDDVRTYLLTGFSSHALDGLAGVLLVALPAPALIDAPETYGKFGLDYLMFSSKPGTEKIFYYGDYTQAMFDTDFSRRATFTVGEALSAATGQQQAPDFRGSVFVLNGQEDGVFCLATQTTIVTGHGNCGSGSSSFPAQVKQLYPSVSKFAWATTPNTGHDVNLHYSAQHTFKTAHDFLESDGY